jgi:hypothetical protein
MSALSSCGDSKKGKKHETIEPHPDYFRRDGVRRFAVRLHRNEAAQGRQGDDDQQARWHLRANRRAIRQPGASVATRSRNGADAELHRADGFAFGIRPTNAAAVVVSAPMPVVEREETRAKTELGAAQKDTARELGAKLASLKGIVWVGVAMFVFGLASVFYPPLKLLIGSVTTSAAICAGGLALMILPTLVVGNELLILGGVGVAVGGWFLAHRHGRLQGFVDANKNGIDDRLETSVKEKAQL